MATISIKYKGDLHCEALHNQSGTGLVTDAPKDNHGRGESFSPTDLVATALGSCILSIMGIAARKLELDISGTTASVDKIMKNKPSRRIGELSVMIRVPVGVSEKNQKILERAALSCPVHKSLHPDVRVPVQFSWGSSLYQEKDGVD